MTWIARNEMEFIPVIPFPLLGVATLITLIFLTRNIITCAKRKFPMVGKSSDPDLRMAMQEGVLKYPNSPFFLPADPPVLIIPKSSIADVKSFSDDVASFSGALRERFYPKITGVGTADHLMVSVVKNDISRQIASSLAYLQDEAAYSFNERLGLCEEWTSFVLYPKLAEIVALVSSRVFVGRPLSRNKDWVDATINYTIEIMLVRNSLPKWPEWIINIVGPHMKAVKVLHKFRDRAAQLMKPILDAQLAKVENEKLYSDEGDEVGNGIAWFLARMSSDQRRDPAKLTNQLLNLSFAAIHTTTNTTTQAIFDLATYREYIPILIDEINSVIAEDGYDITDDGLLRMRKSSMPKLAKLDSFLKESQRLNPLGLISHYRKVVSDVTLSSGHTIPKGINIGIPSWYIHNNSTGLYSLGRTKSLNEFDGLRFYNLRKTPGNENRHLFVSTSQESLSFGHGNHACPGRFFANNEIKVILIELLRNWEFRLPGDIKMEGGAWRRPRNTYRKLECRPDSKARLEFRRKRR